MDEVFKVKKDFERAEDLFFMAKDRLDLIKIYPKDKSYKIIEEYYEVIKELLTAIMYVDGFKTLSHIKLIEYFKENYSLLGDVEFSLIDSLRKFRHGIVYYGKKISSDFLKNHEEKIKFIVKELIKFVGGKLNEK